MEVLKENTHDRESIEKLERFSHDLSNMEHLNWKDRKKVKLVNKQLSFYQRLKKALESDIDIDPGRLMGLTDGIFGMVMTLLIFGIALPELQIASYSDFLTFLSSLSPTVGVTVVSFILISSFWVYHHEFIKVKTLNIPYLWVNIGFLICISFIPFSTSLIGHYSHFFMSEALFGLNIFLTSLFFILMYFYASQRGFLEKAPSKEEKKRVLQLFFLVMGLTVIVNLLDFNVSSNFIYLFLLVPVISTIMDIRYKMEL